MGAKWSFSVCYIACSIRCLLSRTSVWVALPSLALDVNLLSMKKMKLGLKWYFPTATDTTGSWKLMLREMVRQNKGTIKKINDGELHFYNNRGKSISFLKTVLFIFVIIYIAETYSFGLAHVHQRWTWPAANVPKNSLKPKRVNCGKRVKISYVDTWYIRNYWKPIPTQVDSVRSKTLIFVFV